MVDATCVLWRSNTDVPRASAACVAAASSGLVHWINGPNVALQCELPWHADQLNGNKYALFRATARLVAVAQLIVISHEAIVCPRTRVRARMNLLACPLQFARCLSLFYCRGVGRGLAGSDPAQRGRSSATNSKVAQLRERQTFSQNARTHLTCTCTQRVAKNGARRPLVTAFAMSHLHNATIG